MFCDTAPGFLISSILGGKTLTHNKGRGRWNQQGRKHVLRGRAERQSTGLSSHNIKEVPGEEVAEESLVHWGLWGRLEYITVISGTVPQTHGAEKVVQSERGLVCVWRGVGGKHKTQPIPHNYKVFTPCMMRGGLALSVIKCTCLDGRAVKLAGGSYSDKCDPAGEWIHFVARCAEWSVTELADSQAIKYRRFEVSSWSTTDKFSS